MEEWYFHLQHLLFQDSPSEGDLQAGQLHEAMQPHLQMSFVMLGDLYP